MRTTCTYAIANRILPRGLTSMAGRSCLARQRIQAQAIAPMAFAAKECLGHAHVYEEIYKGVRLLSDRERERERERDHNQPWNDKIDLFFFSLSLSLSLLLLLLLRRAHTIWKARQYAPAHRSLRHDRG